jgi:hypothetical protein
MVPLRHTAVSHLRTHRSLRFTELTIGPVDVGADTAQRILDTALRQHGGNRQLMLMQFIGMARSINGAAFVTTLRLALLVLRPHCGLKGPKQIEM